jgi:hypothetical protein
MIQSMTSARSSRSRVLSGNASTRQPDFNIRKKISTSQRRRYPSINSTAASNLVAGRLVSKRHLID